ncbi:HK97 family phage prohead protease [Aureibacillus halotolerans]|uniref:Prohead peptidase n=1 Tax=Aureibacillus halotolerans TaxID=1508390 RepID=A0A4R6TZZ7_9BACI|nr:HK97 family phage prohead protease [Aureibacillus halotolerans]TDQ39231.1 prohead peptidase [Aureibacillus halotolerans]
MGKEIRKITTQIELRAEDEDKDGVIEGYALKFERWSEELGFFVRFKEIIDKNALNEADMRDVLALFNHNDNYPLARNTVSGDGPGALQLDVDGIGLKFRFVPTATSYGNDLKESVRAGVIGKCSFAFEIDPEDPGAEEITYDEAEDMYKRRILKFKRIHDISLVTSPAYEDTEAVLSARSKQKMDELKTPQRSAELEKLKLQNELMDLTTV